ncbi:MAG: haloacid dehalogenase type II [Proteobacteria bacterium]|nr:haloacid dehalogenase type II [Pseudomonadota bacterium]
MDKIIVFDVNETLLDLEPIRTWFLSRFEGEPDAGAWFGELLRLSFVSAVTNRYVPFTELARSALTTVSTRAGADATEQDRKAITNLFVELPPHRDVSPGLENLRSAGYSIAALTNSPQSTAEIQLGNAGISEFFDHIMSVEMVHRFKPHARVYEAAAGELGIDVSAVVMVAAHDWDIAGALAAGAQGVFVARNAQVYSSAFATPTIVARNITDAATQIIERT